VSQRSQWFLVGGIVAAAGIALVVATQMAGGPKVIGPGADAPDFVARTVSDSGEGATVGIAAYRGKPVLLNIWATWCAPCRDEMPRIQQLYSELGAEGLTVVAVSIDNPGMTTAIRDFKKEMGLTFEVVHDESGRIRDNYQTAGVPETFLIDRTGVIRRRLIGAAWTIDEQRPLLKELIAEAPK
jgi:peroxiredoxin